MGGPGNEKEMDSFERDSGAAGILLGQLMTKGL
jgi:hypothetical protein